MQKMLEPNFGRVVYHEDVMRIIQDVTGWDLERCNRLRRDYLVKKNEANPDHALFESSYPAEVVKLVKEESLYNFCLPHIIAFGFFTKQTAVLQALHSDLYLEEIQKFEQKHGFSWSDIGVRWKGVSLMQN